jgi:crotonobetainyl-CoA:carnitine CoA-transferase CaiB-like acyl-CoA transferase
MSMLDGLNVVNLAVNLPGPAAARRLSRWGACVVKVEPPDGDPMYHYKRKFYDELNAGHEVVTLDLKAPGDMERLGGLLASADLLITAQRPAALERLGLGWEALHNRFPRLCQVAIVGYPPPQENEPGHDLTYQAGIGLLTPPQMPRTLIADMAGAEQAASQSLALLLARERGQGGGYAQVALSDAAEYMSEPLRAGLTAPGCMLGGSLPEYNLYETADGWVAVAALEPHFKKRMDEALGCAAKKPEELSPLFKTKTACDWEKWAAGLDLPIVAVKTF